MPIKISDNKRVVALIFIFLVMTLVSGLTSMWVLYQTAFDSYYKNLTDIARIEASMIKARHESKGSHDHQHNMFDDKDIIEQIIAEIKLYKQANEAIEIEIAVRENDNISFLLAHHHSKAKQPKPVAFNSKLAEPMRLALLGKSGTVIGQDYKGVQVLAAYEHIPELSLGVVAKIDVSKVRQPYIRAFITVFIISTLLVALGVYLFIRIGTPLLSKIHENEERFRSLFNESTHFIALLTPQGSVEMLNQTARNECRENIYDYLNRPFQKLSFWQHSAKEQDKLSESIEQLSPDAVIRYEASIILLSGEIIDLDFSLKAITNADNEIVNIIAEGNSISEILSIQKNLQESKQRYQSLVESSEAIPWEMSLWLDRFVFVGPQAIEMLGYPIVEWYKENFWAKHIHPDDVDSVLQFCSKSTMQEGNYDHKYRMIAQNDGIVWIQNYINVSFKAGKATLITGYMFDITSEVDHEEQLRRSQKMDALGKLTGGIAHDYNNMLGIIIGYSNMLSKQLSGHPKLLTYAQRIHEAGQRNAKLTQKLLAFSKDRSLEDEMVNLNILLKEIQHLLEKTLTARIKLIIEPEAHLWKVKLDKDDFADALLNMSINAMHAMSEGGELRITTNNIILNKTKADSLQIKEGEYVELVIADTGIGMDKTTQEKIFDPFFTTKGENGTGLGMSQVYGFIRRLSGAIKLHSDVNQGTVFKIYFPRYIEKKSHKELPKVIAALTKGNETILIVDDEAMLAEMTGEYLLAEGYKIIYAYNGKQALSTLKNHDIDLIISDVIMPEMDGYQLAIKARELYPDIKIQLISGYSDGRHIDENNKLIDPALHKNLLYKPYKIQDLLLQLRKLLDDTDNKSLKSMDKPQAAIQASIIWDDRLSVHISAIDNDHKYLFKVFNYFEQAVVQGNKDDINKSFEQLLNYIKYHFQREEEIMHACDYPGLKKHHQVHEMFKRQIYSYFDDYIEEKLNKEDLLNLYKNWLLDHVSGMDQAIGTYCSGKVDAVSKAMENSIIPSLSEDDLK